MFALLHTFSLNFTSLFFLSVCQLYFELTLAISQNTRETIDRKIKEEDDKKVKSKDGNIRIVNVYCTEVDEMSSFWHT